MNKLPNTPRTYGEVVTIVVDEQNDFFPDGALGVTGADEIVSPTNQLTAWTRAHDGMVVFTRDKHNPETKHFAANGGPWPEHCAAYDDMDTRPQGSEGAALHEDLIILPEDAIASKGMSNEDDGYSGLEAIIEPSTSRLGEIVADMPAEDRSVETVLKLIAKTNREMGKRTLVLFFGLATDYCDKATGLDALAATDRTWVDVVAAEDAMRAVNLAYDDGEKAIAEMKAAGAEFLQTYQIIDGRFLVDRGGER